MDKVQVRQIHREFQIKNQVGETESLPVLFDCSLNIRNGEFLSILGPSGCGKSTLLNILAGLEAFDCGSVEVDGQPLQKRSFNRGMVFQTYALLPWRTVLENMELGLEIRNIGKKERREIALHYLDMVGLSHFTNQYPHQLSGGMRQRVAIARVLAYQPDLLLMDEPFAALDAQTRETLQIELLRIWEADKKTIVFITHSIDEAIILSDRVAIMTARPGYIKDIVEIPLSRPRTEAVRNSLEFARLRQNAWGLLKDEVDKTRRLIEESA